MTMIIWILKSCDEFKLLSIMLYKFADYEFVNRKYLWYLEIIFVLFFSIWHILGGILIWDNKYNHIHKYHNLYDYMEVVLIFRYIVNIWYFYSISIHQKFNK